MKSQEKGNIILLIRQNVFGQRVSLNMEDVPWNLGLLESPFDGHWKLVSCNGPLHKN